MKRLPVVGMVGCGAEESGNRTGSESESSTTLEPENIAALEELSAQIEPACGQITNRAFPWVSATPRTKRTTQGNVIHVHLLAILHHEHGSKVRSGDRHFFCRVGIASIAD